MFICGEKKRDIRVTFNDVSHFYRIQNEGLEKYFYKSMETVE